MFIVINADGSALGRFTIGDPLGPVPDAFAYTFTSREDAAVAAATFPGSTVQAI